MDGLTGGSLGAFGIAVAFGLIVWGMIRLVGPTSGAHINPAVSAAFAFSGHLPFSRLSGYVIAQFLGGLAASFTHVLMWPHISNYGMTSFSFSTAEGFALEFFLTVILMGGIYWAIHTPQREKWVATIAGTIVGFEAWLAGPLCGASMNPARSFGPAVASSDTSQLWVYLVATTTGALATAMVFKARFRKH